ncbi:CCHC-type domain-containing protein [Trichonephila clavipes]|nr:CCHC-type domain-containing protein [Trichonephila clavipes]
MLHAEVVFLELYGTGKSVFPLAAAFASLFAVHQPATDAKRLKGSSPMLMEFLIPIFHIFSGLVVKKLPSSSVSPSGPPTEDSSDAPTHEALDNAYQHMRDLEKQVALSEGKLQESQRCFDSVISSLASHIESTVSCPSSPSLVMHRSLLHQQLFPPFTIPPPPSEQVLLVRPLEPNAGSSTTRSKITSFLLSKNLPFRITRIKNINNGGIAFCFTTDEDDDGFEVNFSIKSKSSNNWVISVIPDLYPVIKDHGYLYLNFERFRIETFISVMQCSTCGTLGHTRNHCSNTQACVCVCFSCSSTDDHDRTSCEPRCINYTNHNVRFRSGFSENHECRDKHCPVLIQFKKRTMDHTDYGR